MRAAAFAFTSSFVGALFAVAMITLVAPLVARGGVVIPFQNGLASPRVLTRTLGAAHVLGAHTDSPNLRLKPWPDTASAGWRQLAVEVYGATPAGNAHDEASGRPYSTRYSGALVADFHRIVLKGGIYLYPATAKSPPPDAGAVIGHLVGVPAIADAEDHAARPRVRPVTVTRP